MNLDTLYQDTVQTTRIKTAGAGLSISNGLHCSKNVSDANAVSMFSDLDVRIYKEGCTAEFTVALTTVDMICLANALLDHAKRHEALRTKLAEAKLQIQTEAA